MNSMLTSSVGLKPMIAFKVSNVMWYPQSGYLSLTKDSAFIKSPYLRYMIFGTFTSIYGINESPLSYADNTASTSTSKNTIYQVLRGKSSMEK